MKIFLFKSIFNICIASSLLFCIWGGSPGIVFSQASSAETPAEKLEDIQKNLNDERKKVQEIESREDSVLSQLSSIDRQLDKVKHDITELNQKQEDIARKLANSDKFISLLQEKEQTQRKYLKKRMRAAYKYTNQGTLELLFSSSTSFPRFVENLDYLKRIIENDRELFREYRRILLELASEKETLAKENSRIAELHSEIERKKEELLREEHRKKSLLASLKNEKALHVKLLAELEETSRRLNQMLEEFEVAAEETPSEKVAQGIMALKGLLNPPVDGAIISGFGKKVHPIFKTVVFQNGVEIEAKPSDPVRAVYAGKVVYVGWMRGYGRMLIVNNGNHFYTLYAHSSKVLVKTGDKVETGQIIAEVGDSGSLSGPCLYFEIRQRRQPLDPLKWLDSSKISFASGYRR